jgi:hypothetical protein
MAEPDWNPDTAGRSLAEILREAGIESAARQRRRRSWDDPDEVGIRQRRAEAAADASARAGFGRRRSDHADETAPPRSPAPRDRRAPSRRLPDPSTAAIPGLRPERKPGVPVAGTAVSAPLPSAPVAAAPPRRPAAPPEERFDTGPIPVVGRDEIDADLDEEATPRESAMAWLRFAGELLIALAAGVGVYFAARVLWELVPYLALLLAPVAVTALVAGVGVWRHKQGREPVGTRLLAVLVFAGTLLTIAPAAGLIASGS